MEMQLDKNIPVDIEVDDVIDELSDMLDSEKGEELEDLLDSVRYRTISSINGYVHSVTVTSEDIDDALASVRDPLPNPLERESLLIHRLQQYAHGINQEFEMTPAIAERLLNLIKREED